jgi:hypothetical protein
MVLAGRAMAWTKVYFHHLKKTGGTALNLWLDSQFPIYPDNFPALQNAAMAPFADVADRQLAQRKGKQALAQAVFADRDLLHDHLSLAPFVPAGTFRLTILRDPVDRLLSQWRDFRRLKPADIAHYPDPIKTMFADIHRLDLRDFLQIYGQHDAPHGFFFDNTQVRAIAENRLGPVAASTKDAGSLLPVALDVLRQDFDCVGDLGRDWEISQMICAAMGWAPVPMIARVNVTDKTTPSVDDIAAAGAQIAALTRHDQALYDAAKALHQAGFAKAQSYDRVQFEKRHLQRRLSTLPRAGRVARYDLTMPLIGSGHGGRRFAGDKTRIIHAIADQPLVLYVPVQRWARGTIDLTFRPDQHLRERLGPVTINGQAVAPVYDGRNGVLSCAVTTGRRNWARLQLDPPHQGPDQRPHLAITGYGWQTQKRRFWF